MNILQVHKFFYPKDGATNHMLSLCAWLEQAGHEVIPFSTKSSRNRETPYSKYFVDYHDLQDVDVSVSKKLQIARQFIKNSQAKHSIRELLKNEKIDVAHIHNIYHHITPVILEELARVGVPVVMTLHDLKLISPNYLMYHHGQIHEEDAKGWYLNCIKNRCIADSRAKSMLATAEMIYAHKIKKYYQRYIKTFIAPSEFVRDKCIEHQWDAKRFVHLPHAINLDTKYVQAKSKGVLFLGRMSEEKGIDVLLDAAKMCPDIPFDLVGEGPLFEHFKLQVRRERLANVTLHGFQSGKELEKLRQTARIVCLPSVSYENYPLSILEAKARGKIVIASNTGGIPELLPEEYLFERGNAVNLAKKLKLWYGKKPKVLDLVGKAMRSDVEANNNPTSYIERLEEIYANKG